MFFLASFKFWGVKIILLQWLIALNGLYLNEQISKEQHLNAFRLYKIVAKFI